MKVGVNAVPWGLSCRVQYTHLSRRYHASIVLLGQPSMRKEATAHQTDNEMIARGDSGESVSCW